MLEADEHDMLHSILSKLPKPLDLDLLIGRAAALLKAHPPRSLHNWAWYHISSNSVLKTTQKPGPLAKQRLADGERFYRRRAGEILRQEKQKLIFDRSRVLVKRYRRPAATAGVLVLAMLIALYSRHSGSQSAVSSVVYIPAGSLRTRILGFLHGLIG
jgi:hypothetical protein